MNEITSKNIDTITGALENYLQHIIDTGLFNLQEFMDFMEPKFAEAGYRIPGGGNILILHDAGVGDFIMMSGAIREIRRLYPTAHITLVTLNNSVALAGICPYVNEVVVNPQKYRRNNFPEMYSQTAKFCEILLKTAFDICFTLACHSETYLLMYMSGARTRIAVSAYIDDEDAIRWTGRELVPYSYLINLATHIVPRSKRIYHRADLNLAMLDNILHIPITNRSLEIWYTALDTSFAKHILGSASNSIYALCMGGTHQRKFYPPEKYARVIEMILREEPDATFVLLGGGTLDLKSAEILKSTIPEIYDRNIIDLTDKINYRQSGAVLSLCDMYIGNCTGTMHMAAAAKCPVIEILAYPADLPVHDGDDPKIYYPYGVPSVVIQPAHALPECARNPDSAYGCTVVYKSHCIAQITPEKIFEGFHLLKQRIAEKNTEPLYIC